MVSLGPSDYEEWRREDEGEAPLPPPPYRVFIWAIVVLLALTVILAGAPSFSF